MKMKVEEEEQEQALYFDDDIEKLLIGNLLDGNDDFNFGASEKCQNNSGKENARILMQNLENRQQKHYQVRKKIVDNNTISVDAERKSGIINEQHLEKLFPLKSQSRNLSFAVDQHNYNALAHGPFNVRNRFVSECGKEQREWPKISNGKNFNPRQIYNPRRSNSYAQINNPQPHSTRCWQPRTFSRTFSHTQLEHKKGEVEEKQPKSAVVIETIEKKQPIVPIGFCPVEKKKVPKKEEKTKAANKAPAEIMPSENKQQWVAMELASKKKCKSPVTTPNAFQFHSTKVTKVRTISLSKVAKIAEEQEVIRAPLVEGDGEMTPAGRFQVLSRIGALSATNVGQQEIVESNKPKRRANSVMAESSIMQMIPIKPQQGVKKSPPVKFSKPLPSNNIWARLLGVLVTMFPIFASIINRSDISHPFIIERIPAHVKSTSAGLSNQKKILKKQNSQNNANWKISKWQLEMSDAGNSLLTHHLGIFGYMLNMFWKSIRWALCLILECFRLSIKSIFMSYQYLRGLYIRSLLGYGQF